MLVEFVTKCVATYLPMGWIVDALFVLVQKQVLGMELARARRSFSTSTVFSFGTKSKVSLTNPGDARKFVWWLFGPNNKPQQMPKKFNRLGAEHTRMLLHALGCSEGVLGIKLASLHIHAADHWVKVEATMRAQEEPPEEIFVALRKLWTIAIHFRMNFFVDRRGCVFRLNPKTPTERLLGWVRWWRARRTPPLTLPNRLRSIPIVYRPRNAVRMGTTLQDLEDEFTAALENLERQLGTAQTNLEQRRVEMNEELLRYVHNSGNQPALAFMLWMCTVTTPTRFGITVKDISDFYARKTAQQVSLLHFSGKLVTSC